MRARSSVMHRAFSLVEVLVVLGVITLLIGLTIPALASVRARAGQTKSIANLHGLGVSVHLYHEQYKSYPYMDDAQQLLFTPPDQTPALRVGISPVWDLERYWPCLMHDIAPWREHYQTWISPGLARENGRAWLAPGSSPTSAGTSIDPSYRYSNSFVGSAEVWSRGPGGEPRIAPQRADMVVSPSAKVLFFDRDASFAQRSAGLKPSDPRPILMADASALTSPDDRALTPTRNRLRPDVPAQMYHDTEDGVRGRDR